MSESRQDLPHLRLGVNIDHVATIRNARGGLHPDPVRAAQLAAEAAREAAITGGLLDQWIEVIRQKVQRNWNKPASAGAGGWRR